VGCGSGQSTRLISPYFKRVIGTDVSESQVEEAKKQCPTSEILNISFRLVFIMKYALPFKKLRYMKLKLKVSI
jgi:ubiquinone/menaquinone biosynthesis C-methylase UbiE